MTATHWLTSLAANGQQPHGISGFLDGQIVGVPFSAPRPEGLIEVPQTLIIALVACLCVAALLIVAIPVLSRPRKQTDAKPHGAHSANNDKKVWRERINEIVDNHAQGASTRDEALRDLAQVARDFAGMQTGKDMSSYTLSDISQMPVSAAADPGLKLLRQTISALYPPEFADVERHSQARETSVEQAGEWVANLIERWRK